MIISDSTFLLEFLWSARHTQHLASMQEFYCFVAPLIIRLKIFIYLLKINKEKIL